ncbi:MAG TPA: AarF/UbiB family protein [Candidatus Elarobacter sp.]|nr:AarF/UbiB family protein [Candidatus Elarobacter sp.]
MYIKVGQMLSTRPDILPKEYVAELQRLQEHVPPMAAADVEAVLCEDLGCGSPADVFRTFDEGPVAAASVAQVHFATLASGEEVAVKVQRRGVERALRRDLELVAGLLNVVAFVAPRMARGFNLRAGFAEFRRYTLQELDFEMEAQTMMRFRKNFAEWHDVVIPEPSPRFVTRRVLTMQRVSGQRVDVIVQTLSSEQRKQLGRRLLEVEMKMFISDGLFHADMHPGNIFFREDGTIVLLDFGMSGRLTEEHRDRFLLYWLNVLQKRTKSAFRHLVAQTNPLKGADETGYFKEFSILAERFYRSTISEYSLTQIYAQIIGAGAKYGFVFPSDLLLQAKALTTAEALAFVLTPDLRFEDEALPVVAREFVRRTADPARLRRRLTDALPELLLLGTLPPEHILERDGDDVVSERLWSSVGAAVMDLIRVYRPDIATFRALIDSTARPVLSLRYGVDASAVLDRIWTRAEERWAAVPPQSSLGATFTVHLAAVTAAAYETFMAEGVTSEKATLTVYDVAWAVYQKMGSAAWSLSAVAGKDDADRMRVATVAFRTFPFSAPSYEWKDVASAAGTVGFDCLRCPVAEYFKTQQLSELCVRTWCALDFPLAEKIWHAKLERSGSIAGGASRCDFRWHPLVASEV